MSLAFGCWDIHLLGGISNSATMINILAFTSKMTLSLSTTTPSNSNSTHFWTHTDFPFQELSQPWPSVQVFPDSNFWNFWCSLFFWGFTFFYDQTTLIPIYSSVISISTTSTTSDLSSYSPPFQLINPCCFLLGFRAISPEFAFQKQVGSLVSQLSQHLSQQTMCLTHYSAVNTSWGSRKGEMKAQKKRKWLWSLKRNSQGINELERRWIWGQIQK